VDDVSVIDEPAAAVAVLDPVRAAILRVLAEPGSASTVATALGLGRQNVNYHLRALESHALVRFVESRPRRGLTERVMVASARSYVVSTAALGDLAVDPSRTDRLSADYLIALGARLVREIGELARRADNAKKPLATLSIDTEIRFASASDRAAFTADLRQAVLDISAKYHNTTADGGRWHRVVAAAHPRPATRDPKQKEPVHE
jgi:DNA-binding transcriptional ArsR family regulator